MNKYLTKIVAASLLGDATISKDDSGNRNRNGNFRIKQLFVHKDHLDYLKERLETLTAVRYFEYVAKPVVICGKETVQNPFIMLKTMNHPAYTVFRQRMYPYGRKVIDPHYLTLLDWEFLAIWYMQDGYRKVGGRSLPTAQICTDCFTYGDHELLRVALKEKLGMHFDITPRSTNKSGVRTYRLTLNTKEFPIFVENIFPFMQSSYYYKLDNSYIKPRSSGEDMIRPVQECTELDRNDLAIVTKETKRVNK